MKTRPVIKLDFGVDDKDAEQSLGLARSTGDDVASSEGTSTP